MWVPTSFANKSRRMFPMCYRQIYTIFLAAKLGPKNVQEKQTLSTALGNVFIENDFLQMNNEMESTLRGF